jgi:dienelactone hydrolase
VLWQGAVQAQDPAKPAPSLDTSRGDRMIAEYFRAETAKLSQACLSDIRTLADWTSRRAEYLRQLREMLGLDPWPERTPLNSVVTGKVEHDEFTVEKVYFQSSPGLYVTANLYVPKNLPAPAPAILYVCGHGQVKEGNVSFGNKTYYQHHGGWFARNGYVCLTIDTLQLGEIEGVHHGTARLNQWWWNARGYTATGVEAWNGIRAVDYLETRPEVDRERIGVTGRSGGGIYSWWAAALDERIKVAVPVAGITDLHDHVVTGAVEQHCDCMYFFNTYRWDYAQLAALVAPRPLLISNTDKDHHFALEGVVNVHEKVRRIYRLYGAEKNLGLQITEGPHADTQELHLHAFRWFNRFLKNDTSPIEKVAVKFFKPADLRVFDRLPADQINTTIQETFVPAAPAPSVPESAAAWQTQRDAWLAGLREKVFRGWPEGATAPVKALELVVDAELEGIRLLGFDFVSEDSIKLRLYLTYRGGLQRADLDLVVLNVLDQPGWLKWLAMMRPAFAEQLQDESLPPEDRAEFDSLRKLFQSNKWGMAWVAPRGIGPTAWDQSPGKQRHIRRRFQVLGQTLDGMRVWDVRRAVQGVRVLDGLAQTPLWLQGDGEMAGIALYASLFEPNIARLDLWQLPPTHRNGPDLMNVQRVLDLPAAVALTAERSKIRMYGVTPTDWEYPQKVAQQLGWPADRIQIRAIQEAEPGGK